MNERGNKKWILFAIVLGFAASGILAALPARAAIPITVNTTDDASSDMAVDSSGGIHVVYERGGTIYYTVKSGSHWTTEETVGTGSSPAIAVDSSGIPHVAFISAGVKYTNRSSGAWMETPETVGGSAVNRVDVDVDGSGHVHVLYSDTCCDDPYNEIYYTNNTEGSFSPPTMLFDGWFDGGMRMGVYYSSPSIKVDASGNYYISYVKSNLYTGPGEPDWDEVRCLSNLLGDVGSPTGFSYGSAYITRNGIVLDDDGEAHLVYSSGSTLYYGWISGAGGWTENTGWATGSQASLNVDASKNVYIIYVDDSGGISYVLRHHEFGFGEPTVISSTTSGRNPMIIAELWPRSIFEAHDGTDYEVFYARVGPVIDVSPSSFDFGSVDVGSTTDPQTFTISSIGTMDLSVTDFTLSDSTNYTLDASGCGGILPFILTPGSSCTVKITFHPTTSGPIDAEFTIISNDITDSTFTVSLTGTGAKFTLAVSKAGSGNGTVSSSPEGIACGEDCSEQYDPDTTVTLTAVSETGSHFVSWDGCDIAEGHECTVTMNANKEVTATFALEAFTLTVEKGGTGSGSVTSSPVGIDCGSDCSEAYDYGTSVILTAMEDIGSTFTGWEGCDTAEGNLCTVTVTSDTMMTANFTLNTYTLTLAKNGTGQGSVTSSPAGIHCGSDCLEDSGTFSYGTPITLTATANARSSFEGWEGCDSVNGNQCTITVLADADVTATFSHVPGDVSVCLTGCDHDSIQAAIDASGPGDTIKVAQGIYHENITVNESKEFTLQGGWNNTFTVKASDPTLTVIDGEVEGVGAGTGSVLSFDAGSGVAIHATIENLTLRNGSRTEGGGIRAEAYDLGSLDLTLSKNIIRDNEATQGGGIFVSSTSSGGIRLTMINNFVFNNNCPYGGGIYLQARDSSTLTASLYNNTITDNDADTGGGMLATSGTEGVLNVWVTHSILWGNSALTSGDDLYVRGVNTTVNTRFSDIGVVVNDEGDPGTYTEDTNMKEDPIFINPLLGDYRINADSPCRDSWSLVGGGAPPGGIALPDDDFEGQARPQGNGYDIGADEYALSFGKKIKVLAFNGGEFLPSGETWNITWWAPEDITTFNLSYSVDNGVTWKSIQKGVQGNHFPWRVPAFRNNKKAKVKVVGLKGSVKFGADTSDGAFTINVVRVISPNGGEELFSGNSWPIYWEINETIEPLGYVELYYTTNNGTTWKFIDTPNEEGYYKWYPEVLSDKTKCRVKVVLKTADGRIIGSDVSDKVFTIRAGD